MPEAEKCPRCGEALVVHGSIFNAGFRPKGLKFFSLSFQLPEVPVPSEAAACAACGLVWSELNPATLQKKSTISATRRSSDILGWALPSDA
jgi:hypothetical protein